SGNDCFRLSAELKMFMFDDSGIWSLPVCVVYHSHTLMIFLIQDLCLKSQAPVFQFAIAVIIERIYGSGIEDFFSQFLVFFSMLIIIHSGFNITALEKFLYEHIVSSDGDSLI